MTMIAFDRCYLAAACCVGFMAQHIDHDWCGGWVRTDRLHMIDFPYTVHS